jgi:hypothetical protein
MRNIRAVVMAGQAVTPPSVRENKRSFLPNGRWFPPAFQGQRGIIAEHLGYAEEKGPYLVPDLPHRPKFPRYPGSRNRRIHMCIIDELQPGQQDAAGQGREVEPGPLIAVSHDLGRGRHETTFVVYETTDVVS